MKDKKKDKSKKKNPFESIQETWEAEIADEVIPSDVLGSYTGIPKPLNYDGNEGNDCLIPQQDADDL